MVDVLELFGVLGDIELDVSHESRAMPSVEQFVNDVSSIGKVFQSGDVFGFGVVFLEECRPYFRSGGGSRLRNRVDRCRNAGLSSRYILVGIGDHRHDSLVPGSGSAHINPIG